MSVTLDNQRIFGDETPVITTDSVRRSFVERFAAGLDGVISIDLGSRGRKLKQTGCLRARSFAELADKIVTIETYLDGRTHSLVSDDDGIFENLRMDTFKVKQRNCDGSGVNADYEISYTQLI